jgi:hypothetical protein
MPVRPRLFCVTSVVSALPEAIGNLVTVLREAGHEIDFWCQVT